MTQDQFTQLILPLKNKLFRLALAYLGNEEEAKDVVQEVMLKTWEEVDDPASIRNLEAWCIRLAKNNALDRLKRKGRNPMPVETQYALPSKEGDPLYQTEVQESLHRIRHIISSLSEKQRAVITLRDVEGYTYQEVAEIMQIEINHVKVLLHRARNKVKERLSRIYNHGISKAS